MGGDPLESATDPVGGGGSGDDDTYWSTPEYIHDLEIKLAEAKKDESEDRINESIMQLSIALVYSREDADRQRGITMLEASLTNSGRVFQEQKQQMLHMLAVGYHRSGDYPTSMRYLDLCLEIAPNWGAALSLKKTVEEQYARSTYLLAVRYHRSGDYLTSLCNLDLCLEIAPNCEEALTLKKTCEEALSVKKTIEEQRARARSFYLLAVEFYRSGDYQTSMRNLDLCLEIEPNSEEALSLKKTIEEKCARSPCARSPYSFSRIADSWTGIGIAVGGAVAVGGVAAVYGTGVVGGMAAAVAVRRGLVFAATTGAILAAKKMATSAMKN